MPKADIAAALRTVLPADCLLWREEDRRPYECDALTAFRRLPALVALPRSEEQVRRVLRTCSRLGIPVVARGAGTGLSGGSTPHEEGVLLSCARLNRILTIDPLERIARVEPGVPNLKVSEAAAAHGLYYAPDPSSQVACSIGGNVAENSGGVHCLKYGLTVHNVLGVRGYTIDGELLELRGREHAQGVGVGARAAQMVVRTQECLPRRRAALARLLLHGRHDSAQARRRGAGRDLPHGIALWPALHERVPRRRRESPPPDPVRRQRSGLLGARRAFRYRDPRAVRRARRNDHRRARRRPREVEPHVRAVLTRRAGRRCGRDGGVPPERAPQSGQAHPDPGALRGVRPDAGASRRPAPRRAAALLKRSVA